MGPTYSRAAATYPAQLGQVLLGRLDHRATRAPWTIEVADDTASLTAYSRLRHEVFVVEQGLFDASDHDDVDDDPRRIVLLARNPEGELIGGVRLAPVTAGVDLGWWSGGRLVVAASARRSGGLGPALVRAACAHAEAAGVIRFEASVQAANETMFRHLGWTRVKTVEVRGTSHVKMRWQIERFAAQAAATKGALGPLLAGLNLGGAGFVGDDGVPVPGSDLIAACDAILPSLVERDPEWAGWCAVLVNINDLAAMGAEPIGLLDAVAARDASFAARIFAGLRRGSEAFGVPVLGGHTQLGTPAALSVTALGRTSSPVPAAGGRPGHQVWMTADLRGQWRPGYTGRQWDSSSTAAPAQLRELSSLVRLSRPAAAKDVSMAGVVGTLGMLAEASGCAAVLDVARVPIPSAATMGDWLSCFPGFAMLMTDVPGRAVHTGTSGAASADCGELIAGAGVSLRWPDGEVTPALAAGVTGLGAA